MTAAFFSPGGFEHGPARPAETREKSTRAFLKIMVLIPRIFLLYVCGLGGLPLAPLLRGLAVVRAAFRVNWGGRAASFYIGASCSMVWAASACEL